MAVSKPIQFTAGHHKLEQGQCEIYLKRARGLDVKVGLATDKMRFQAPPAKSVQDSIAIVEGVVLTRGRCQELVPKGPLPVHGSPGKGLKSSMQQMYKPCGGNAGTGSHVLSQQVHLQ